MKILLLLTLVLLTTACGFEDQKAFNPDNLESLSLVRDFELSEDNGIIFGNIVDIQLDTHGNIYVLDLGRKSILIFSGDGELIQEFKKEGSGPGEFVNIDKIYLEDDSLFFVDSSLLRISEYEILNDQADLQHIEDILYPNRAYTRIEHFWKYDDQTFAFVFFKDGFSSHDLWEEKFAGLQLFNKREQSYTEILEVPGREFFRFENERGFGVGFLPFGKHPIFLKDGEHFIYGNNSEFNIKFLNTSADTSTTLFNIDFEPLLVTEEDRSSVIENEFYQNMNITTTIEEQLPNNWPVYSTFLLDDFERFWFAMNTINYNGGNLWWVFDRSGQGLYKVELDEPVNFKKIKNESAYGIIESDEIGQSLVKYSISM